ncbi:synaptotagmin-like protein 2 [Engraulis encrasicolus]|uniref:synaptotagmin-like protein 2 n=1 Tax=Engraulis encrasicolus TaxID=184585 RepID=UPI002FD170BA
MKPSSDFADQLDLSFLSAEEEAAILKVLQRDENLRKQDTGRVRRLKANAPDPEQLRVLTGEWFEDLKAKRYGQPCDITAVVKCSMRKKKTSAPKINPFMNYTTPEEDDKGGLNSNQLSVSNHPPAFTEKTYREYNDEDFNLNYEPTPSAFSGGQKSPSYHQEEDAWGRRQPAGKSTNPFLSAHTVTDTPISTAPAASPRPGNDSPGANESPPAESSSSRTFAFLQSPFKSSTPPPSTKDVDGSKRVSLPPALRKGTSVEDSWVKISVEPNTADLNQGTGPLSTGTGSVRYGYGAEAEIEPHTSCSSSDSEESQAVPRTPSEPVLLSYNPNASEDEEENIPHVVSARPVPRQRSFAKGPRNLDPDLDTETPEAAAAAAAAAAAVAAVAEDKALFGQASSSSSSSSTTAPTETAISYEVASSRSLSPGLISCHSSSSSSREHQSTGGHDDRRVREEEEEAKERENESEGEITLKKKQPRMNFFYQSRGTSNDTPATGGGGAGGADDSGSRVEESERIKVSDPPPPQDPHASAYVPFKMASRLEVSVKEGGEKGKAEETGASRAFGVGSKAFTPRQPNKSLSIESEDSPRNIREPAVAVAVAQPAAARPEQPGEDKLDDFFCSPPETEYKIPKLSSRLLIHAGDEIVCSDLSYAPPSGDGRRASQNENERVERENVFEATIRQDEFGMNQRQADRDREPPAAGQSPTTPQHTQRSGHDGPHLEVKSARVRFSPLATTTTKTTSTTVEDEQASTPANYRLFESMQSGPAEEARRGEGLAAEEEEEEEGDVDDGGEKDMWAVEEDEGGEKRTPFLMRSRVARKVLPSRFSDDHMTRGRDRGQRQGQGEGQARDQLSHSAPEEVTATGGGIETSPDLLKYDHQGDEWRPSTFSASSSASRPHRVTFGMAEDSLTPVSTRAGVDSEDTAVTVTTVPSGTAASDTSLSSSSDFEVTEFNYRKPTVPSGFDRQEKHEKDNDGDARTTVESSTSSNPFQVWRGNPFVPAIASAGGGDHVRVSVEEPVAPEHVSSSVDVRPLIRPEDQPEPTSVQMGSYKVPSIVIMPSETQHVELKKEGGKSPMPKAVKGIVASAEGEDDTLDTDDDDQSSVSSFGSDLSGRKNHLGNKSFAGRTGSLLSIYSEAGDFGNVVVQGAVEFAMMYSPAEELIIMVEQCQDLAHGNARKQRTDPYVKTYLHPDKFRRTKRKTSIKKQTTNPVFVESLRYKIKKRELHDKTLNLSVWHNDSRGRNVFLGQVELDLNTWDWGHEALTWYNLQPKGGDAHESQDYRGTLFVAVKYVPPASTGKLLLSHTHLIGLTLI